MAMVEGIVRPLRPVDAVTRGTTEKMSLSLQ
uniref:Uncharacterized protein n=1 Tax=Anguilla anguilla TaxID=7936 RepID=A0A0E9RXD3_ANGAN